MFSDISLGAGEDHISGQVREQCPYGWVEATFIDFGIRDVLFR